MPVQMVIGSLAFILDGLLLDYRRTTVTTLRSTHAGGHGPHRHYTFGLLPARYLHAAFAVHCSSPILVARSPRSFETRHRPYTPAHRICSDVGLLPGRGGGAFPPRSQPTYRTRFPNSPIRLLRFWTLNICCSLS